MTRQSLRRTLAVLVASLFLAASAPYEPGDSAALDASFRDLLGLEAASNPRISPDGAKIAYSVGTTDWEANRYDTEIWISVVGQEAFQLTRTEDGSSTAHVWHPNGEYLAFAADRGDDRQVYRIFPDGGEAVALTAVEGGVGAFAFSPDGQWIAFSRVDSASDEEQSRERLYGGFAVEDESFRMSHLWVQAVDPDAEPRRLTQGDTMTIGSFRWSPDGTRIVFDHRPTPQVDSFPQADISIVEVASGSVEALVTDAGPDSGPRFSPDGNWVLYSTPAGANPYYGNNELALVPADGGAHRIITQAFDENPSVVHWDDRGIWFLASQRTARQLFVLDPADGSYEAVLTEPENISAVDFARASTAVAVLAESRTSLRELYRADGSDFVLEQVTAMTDQVADEQLGTREVIRWQSQDGAEIEGVLFKPDDFDPGRRYPLMVVIHGGPTGTSRPQLVSGYVYPVLQWLRKGALVLMPNYRGSAGYGADFRALNVRNLGVGDAWDVVSGVDALVDRGMVDGDRVASMGWSQGGYISAFLTTHSDRFQAISVGAGISDWMTYYVNTDIHGFTRNYLESTPWDDPEIYARTSPMSGILQASTPTLIQHGEFDARVPTPNAYQLYQGLQDVGVPTRLVIYKGFGHGITKPKERLAALWHNWIWFAEHLWGEEWQLPLEAQDEAEEAEPGVDSVP